MDDFLGYFDNVRREQAQWRETAKHAFIPGIDAADMKPGMLVTVSPNLRFHDRSYTDTIWRVLHVNAMHAQIEALDGFWQDRGPRLLMHHEHHFYSAEGFVLPADGALGAPSTGGGPKPGTNHND